MSIDENKIKEELFNKGLDAFEDHNFYDAHEHWEDLWSDFRLKDAKFIQALIQLSVGYFHITNLNINGARGLLNKCKPKFELYLPESRGINVLNVLSCVDNSLNHLEKNTDLKEFDWNLVPKLKDSNAI